jgi:hypothetical protein
VVPVLLEDEGVGVVDDHDLVVVLDPHAGRGAERGEVGDLAPAGL